MARMHITEILPSFRGEWKEGFEETLDSLTNTPIFKDGGLQREIETEVRSHMTPTLRYLAHETAQKKYWQGVFSFRHLKTPTRPQHETRDVAAMGVATFVGMPAVVIGTVAYAAGLYLAMQRLLPALSQPLP